MLKHAIIGVISLLFSVGSYAAPASLARLGWLAGAWQFEKDGRVVTELWMAPEGMTMLGMSRTVVAGTTKEYEFVLLRETDDQIVYIARPSGQEEAKFVLRSLSDVEVVFENPAHDFPQLIRYRLNPDGGMLATIEGTVRGKSRRVEFPYRRVR